MSVHKRVTDRGVRWDVRYRDPGGVQRKKSFLRKADADDFEDDNNSKMRRGLYIDPKAGRVTFKQVAEDWMEAQTHNRSTRQAMELRLRLHVFPVIGKMPVAQIKPSNIQALTKQLEPLAPSYRRVIIVNTSSILSAAVADGLMATNPAAAVKRPKVEPRVIKPWPKAHVHAMYEALPDRWNIVAILGAGLGLRQGEMFGLSPDDVDFLGGKVHVRRQVKVFGDGSMAYAEPKGAKVRTVPLPRSVQDELAAYLVRFPAKTVTLSWDGKVKPGTPKPGTAVTVPLFLTNRESNALNRNYFNAKVWKPALVAAGIEATRDNGCHALRHYYASMLLSGGATIKAVSEYLGHADAAFTLRTYTHRMEENDDNARKAVDAALTANDDDDRKEQQG